MNLPSHGPGFAHRLRSLGNALGPGEGPGEEREPTAVSMVVGLRFSLSTAYTLGDIGRRSDGDCGSVESLRLKEITRKIAKRMKQS